MLLPSGRCRATAAASFAVVSCSNYPTGYFNVYREVAQQPVDAVLHLGDYIYEYAPGGYASANAEALGRVVEPATEILTLTHYRTRYAQYRSDPDLQAAHAAHPFIYPDFASGGIIDVDATRAAVAARSKAPGDRTLEEQMLLDSAIPYNLDAWDGYDFERNRVLDFAAQLGSRLVVLAGDTHNAWSSQLRGSTGEVVGVEFATASVTSPGLDAVLGADAAALFAPLMSVLVDDLVYANFLDRGYLTVVFAEDAVTAEWRYVSTIDSTEYLENDAAFQRRAVQRADLLLS